MTPDTCEAVATKSEGQLTPLTWRQRRKVAAFALVNGAVFSILAGMYVDQVADRAPLWDQTLVLALMAAFSLFVWAGIALLWPEG